MGVNGFDPVAERLAAIEDSMAAARAAGDRHRFQIAWSEAVSLRLTQFLDEWESEADEEDDEDWGGDEDWGPAESWPAGPWDEDRWGIPAGEEVGR